MRTGRLVPVFFAVVATIMCMVGGALEWKIGYEDDIFRYMGFYVFFFLVLFFSKPVWLRVISLLTIIGLNIWILSHVSWSNYTGYYTMMCLISLASGVLAMIFPRNRVEGGYTSGGYTPSIGGGYTSYTGGGYTSSHPLLTAERMLALVRNGESCSTCSNRFGDCPFELGAKYDIPNVNGVNICHKHSEM